MEQILLIIILSFISFLISVYLVYLIIIKKYIMKDIYSNNLTLHRGFLIGIECEICYTNKSNFYTFNCCKNIHNMCRDCLCMQINILERKNLKCPFCNFSYVIKYNNYCLTGDNIV